MEDIDLTRMKESDVVDEIFNSTLSEIVVDPESSR